MRRILFITCLLFPASALAGPTFIYQSGTVPTNRPPYRIAPAPTPEERFQEVEDNLIEEHTPPPAPKEPEQPAPTPPAEVPPSPFGKIGGVGKVGGVGPVGLQNPDEKTPKAKDAAPK